MKSIKKRGASFFTIDAMIAGMIIIATIISISSFQLSKPKIEDVQTVLNNYVDYITKTNMNYFNKKNRLIYYDENESMPDAVVIQKVAYLWDKGGNFRNISKSFVKNITKSIFPDQFGFVYKYNGSIIYSRVSILTDSNINLSINLATFYVNDSKSFIGPKTTTIQVWS